MSYASSRETEHARRPVAPAEEQDAFQFTTGIAGDHPAVHQLLLAVFGEPSMGEFQSQLDEPSYEPNDRLLVKRRGHVIAHVRVADREMHFGACILPVSCANDLATLPEFRGQGCGSTLLEIAERRMIDNGAVLGLLRTARPEFYQKRGWVRCGGMDCSTAGPRHILSYLSEVGSRDRSLLKAPAPDLHIRFWRHVEQAALWRLYEEDTRGTFGSVVRSEAYWRWLVARQACDRIYIAIEGSPKLELDDTLHPVVGYAFAKEGRIVELVTSERRPDADWRLLARICSDAIENDVHEIRLDAPHHHPLHQIIAAAGGVNRCSEDEGDLVFMVKVLDAQRLISLMKPELHRRAAEGGLQIPCELGFAVDGQKRAFEITKRSVKLRHNGLGRSYVQCAEPELTQLLLGQLDIDDALSTGRITVSTRLASEATRVLLPRLPVWRPPLDDLPA